MNDKITVNVTVANVQIPMMVEQNDEHIIRVASKQANEAITAYQKKFLNCTEKDVLAMVTLHFAIKALEAIRDNESYINNMTELTKLLENSMRGE